MKTSLALAEFHLRSLWNWRTLNYSRLAEPFAYFGLLLVGIGGLTGPISYNGGHYSYARFVFPGVVALIALRTWSAVVVDVSNDRKWGVFATARIDGASPLAYALSVSIATSLVALTQIAIVYALLAVVPGGGVSGRAWLMALVALPILVTWILLGIAVGLRVNSYHQRDLVSTLIAMPIVFTSPLFYDLRNAPAYLRVISYVNPLTYHAELLRAIMLGSVGWTALAVSGILLCLSIFAAIGPATRRVELISGGNG